MKKLYYITCVIVLACVIASGIIIPITTEARQDFSAKNISASDDFADEYIIKSKGDRIVVYMGNSDKPYIETTTAVSSLPNEIQKRLNIGIRYKSEKSMQKALDEFCS